MVIDAGGFEFHQFIDPLCSAWWLYWLTTPHCTHTHLDATQHTRMQVLAEKEKNSGVAHMCSDTGARQSVITISVVCFSYAAYRLPFIVRHRIVYSCLRLAPHLRRHIWEGAVINKSNRHNQWSQSLQSSLDSTLLLATPHPHPQLGEGRRVGGIGCAGKHTLVPVHS